MSTNATLRDVARLAGVSLGTASHALNNRTNVLPETRARVIDAATTLGYPIKPPERDSRAKLAVIGMLTKHDWGLPIEINPFFSHVQLGVESECRANNISLMYANVDVDGSNHPIGWPRMVSDGNIDGLIMVGTFIEDAIGGLNRMLNKPIVLVDSYAPNLSFDNVEIANESGAFAAVDYLVKQGHRHIGLIGWNADSPPDIQERRDGYLRALQANHIAGQYVIESAMQRSHGYTSLQRMVKDWPHVTAVFVTNDDTAIGVLNAAQDMGLDVPRDLSIVGFDNIDLAAELKPALTTVHVHKTWLGKFGVQRLIERTRDPDQPQVILTLATQLIERESVAKPSR